jgi:hypothetical protein
MEITLLKDLGASWKMRCCSLPSNSLMSGCNSLLLSGCDDADLKGFKIFAGMLGSEY